MYVCSGFPTLPLSYQNKSDCDQGTIIPRHCPQLDGFKAGNFPQISSSRTHKQTVQIEPPPQPLQDDRALSVWTVIIAIKKAIWRPLSSLWMEDWMLRISLGDQSGTISIIPQTPHHHICSNGESERSINPIIRLEPVLCKGLRFIVAINHSDHFLIALKYLSFLHFRQS